MSDLNTSLLNPEDFAALRFCVNHRDGTSDTKLPMVLGEGSKNPIVAFVGECPGMEEAVNGRPFIGPSGKLLRDVLSCLDLKEEEYYITNVCKCFSPTKHTDEQYAFCAQGLLDELREISPRFVVALGAVACNALGADTRRGVASIGFDGRRVLSVRHPAYVLRKRLAMDLFAEDMKKIEDMKKSVFGNGGKFSGYMLASEDNLSALQGFVDILNSSDNFLSFDTETYPLDPYTKSSRLYTVQVSTIFDGGVTPSNIVIPIHEAFGGTEKTREFARKVLTSKAPKCAFNAFYDMTWIKSHLGVFPENLKFDAQIACHLNDETTRVSLKNMAVMYTDFGDYWSAIDAFKVKDIVKAGVENVCRYGAYDAEGTLLVTLGMYEETMKNYGHIYKTLLMPATNFLVKLKTNGAFLDIGYAKTLSGELESEMKRMEGEISATPEVSKALEKFSIGKKLPVILKPGSPKQVGMILKELGVSTGVTTKTGAMSTDKDALEGLKGIPFVDKILEWRKWAKLNSTYVTPAFEENYEGYFHANFNINGARTGRLSSDSPNLENVTRGPLVKRMYISRYGEEGRILESDYSQLEIRVLAMYTHDPELIRIFNSGEDLHSAVGEQILKKPASQITEEERAHIKTMHFGIAYGGGPDMVAEGTGMSREEAQKFINEYYLRFRGVKQWQDKISAGLKKSMFVYSLYGRRRILIDLLDDNDHVRWGAVRKAINTPIQGHASDLTLLGATIANNEFEKRGMLEVHPFTIVHDSLVLDIHVKWLKDVLLILRDVFENLERYAPFVSEWKNVPLQTEFKVGLNWGDAEKIKNLDKWLASQN